MAPCRKRRVPRSQSEVEELVEIAADVVAEGRAVAEAPPAVERQRRLEGGAAAGLQAERPQAARLRLTDDVLEEGGGYAPAQVVRVGAHRLELGRAAAEL